MKGQGHRNEQTAAPTVRKLPDWWEQGELWSGVVSNIQGIMGPGGRSCPLNSTLEPGRHPRGRVLELGLGG